jgi:hypothetical protein
VRKCNTMTLIGRNVFRTCEKIVSRFWLGTVGLEQILKSLFTWIKLYLNISIYIIKGFIISTTFKANNWCAVHQIGVDDHETKFVVDHRWYMELMSLHESEPYGRESIWIVYCVPRCTVLHPSRLTADFEYTNYSTWYGSIN